MKDTSILFVPSLLWEGNCHYLHKVPFHTFGSIKKRSLRLKPCEPSSIDWVNVTIVNGAVSSENQTKAAYPLALVWGDVKTQQNDILSTVSPAKTAFMPSPFSKRVREENEVLLQDIVEINHGNGTTAFQAFIAKNGSKCIPHSSCCFSIVTSKRSVDFFVSSGGISNNTRDAELAIAWVDSLKSLLHSFHQRQRASVGILQSSLETIRQKDAQLQSRELFEAAGRADLRKIRYLFDSGVPVDLMEESTGDTVLIVACRRGFFDVSKLCLHEYQAKNDPHPHFGQTGTVC
jgi:hypothetical protein